MTARGIISLLAGGALTACSMAPAYHRPSAVVPVTWPTGAAYGAPGDAALPRYSYRQVLADPRLVRLIDTALTHNQDVALAVAQIAEARANYRIQRAALFPEIDAAGSYTREGGNAATSPGDNFALQGGISAYEVDLFGRVRSLVSQQRQQYLASVSAARAARLSLVANVAQAWLEYGSDVSLLDLARRTAASAASTRQLTAKRVTGGIAALGDQRKAEVTLATAEADVASQTTLLAQDINALRLLLGAEVDPADLPGSIEDASARLAAVPAGLDSSILLRRPDVVEAEYQLRAANAGIGAARAALFPKITLTTLLGVASQALSSLFTAGAFTWSAGADASYAIFAGGRLRAGVKLSEAQRDAALATYKKAIQSAFQDVSDVLARQGTIARQLAAAKAGSDAATDDARLTDQLYRGGIASALDSFTAQQTAYAQQKVLVSTRLTAAGNLVSLYRALGGDAPGEDDATDLPASGK